MKCPRSWFLLASGILVLSACDDEVAGPTGVDEPFAVYGIMNPRLGMQTLLVGPTATSLLDYDETIDASVTSTDLSTGADHVWRDSVVVGARGQSDHIFIARFRPDFASRHRVVVRRSDGETSEVDVAVPGRVTFEVDDDGTEKFAVRVLGEAFGVVSAEVTYAVRRYAPLAETPVSMCKFEPLSFITLPLVPRSSDVGGVWIIEWSLQEQLFLVRSHYAIEHDIIFHPKTQANLALMKMDLEITVGSRDWKPPNGTFDRNLLSSPDVLANVTNGLGFVGAGYNQGRGLWPSEDAVADAGVYDFLMRPPGDCLDFCSCGLFD